MTKRAHDGEGDGWFKRVLKTLPLVSSFVPADNTTNASPVRRENFKFEREEPKNDEKEQDFEFTLKKHTPPSKSRKVLDASVHDQSNDDELYVPGTYSEPVVRYAKARREEPIVPVNLFEERPTKQAKLTRGGLIKTYALTREERRQKRPAPSRLLAAQTMEERQEHAKLVTERILATLKSLESDPLTIEKEKPTPNLTMSWKKYELESQEEEKIEEIAAKKSAIPTQSLPLFAQPPVVQPKPFMAPTPVLNSVSPAPFSSTSTTTTPAPVQAPKKQASNGFVPQQPVNVFSFGLPTKESGFVEKEALSGVPVTFSFSKPPALKVAPVKALSAKKPAVQPVKVVPAAAPVSSPPTFAKTNTPTPVTSNPLAKFAQSIPGGWRCPSCFVSNQPTASKCPCCDTSKPAPVPAPKPTSPVKPVSKPPVAPTPALSSSNPLAKFMTHAPGSWSCPSCKVRNQAEQSKCPCCDTPKPIDNEEASKPTESKKRKSDDDKPSTSSADFGFGLKDTSAASATPAPSTTSLDIGGFSFTAPPKDTTPAVTIDSDKPAPSFSFSAPKTLSKHAESTTGFSFGVSSDKPAASTGFSFGAPAEKPAEKPSASTPSFSFGTTPGKPAEKTPENPPVGFSFTAHTDKPIEKVAPTPSFSFGAPAEKPSEKPADKPAFSFGVSPVDKPQEKASATPSFGAPTDKPAEKPSFSFGAAPIDKPADKPSFSFGSSAPSTGSVSFGTSDDKSKEDKSPVIPTPSFSFGGDKSSDKPASSFTFGQSASQSAPATTTTGDKPAEKPAPSFTFGQPAAPAPTTVDKPGTGFSFGGSPDKTLAPTFGTAPTDKPSFTFGAANDKSVAAPGFSFGSSTIENPTEKTSPGFTFADAPSSTLSVKRKSQVDQSTAFGTNPPNPAVTSTFGSSAAPTTSFGTTPAPSTTFGAAPPATSTFGAPSSATPTFGAPVTTTPSFGAPTPAPAFGGAATFGAAPPAPTLGASAPGNVPMGSSTFGSNASAQNTIFGAGTTFGSSATTFNAPVAPAFGAAPAMNSTPSATPTFGAPASNTFGSSTSFGSSAPAFNPPAFGAGAPATNTGFGGSFATPPAAAPAFGGSNFNAPAASFGGAPAPQFNNGGFNNNSFNPSGAGGFSMGAAPPKKDGTRRRIVRAQPRNILSNLLSMENVNIGNYKGVMLCNRPFNSVSTVSKEVDSAKKAPFLGGIQPSHVGQNVPIFNESPHAVKRDKKNTALSKHKKWLYDLQKERERLEEVLMEDEASKEERKERFSKREAEMRNKVRQRMPQDDDDKAIRGRPAWALTKDKADCKRDQEEDEDVDHLLEFANNLDIDAFMDDVELKAQVAHVDEQMAQLQKLVNQEEADEKKQEVKELLQNESLERQVLNAANLSRLDTKGNDSDDDDAKSVASTVLSECKSIRSVHSSRSVLALTRRAEQKLTTHLESIPEPNVVTHDEEGGMRLQNKHLTSNLPYMHRNPAV
ncbi:hypothetical protein THRCLA_06770 [Thraustotheca clavata]|uniref:RanBP2-type domain-containing protein n=1 Tax=Thraustotheca clavata TaxID=74557 RepID=A0A1V9ZJS8_9STRA|nr:hypothetical protein THRCLA_06770 [Thraustotheca clavata]